MPQPNDIFQIQLPHTLSSTSLPGLAPPKRGKVRDIYTRGQDLILITTDRVSAFDHVLTTLPFKGLFLNQISAFWFEKTKDVVENHVVDVPDPNVLVARACKPLPIEVVVRAHLTGSLWRDYQAGRANAAYGISLPAGMKKDEAFPEPIVTPSTKAEHGEHDAPLSEEKLVADEIVPREVWAEVRRLALLVFARGQAVCAERGLVLVDTKYEFGLLNDRVILIDEIHTPDSSRYWIADGSPQRVAAALPQQMLDKENLRQWLINERGFSGQGPLPKIPDDIRVLNGRIYAKAYHLITGGSPTLKVGEIEPRIVAALQRRGCL